jgi:radical SAM superfamily enzyme YgiQ (UPF0313 family)
MYDCILFTDFTDTVLVQKTLGAYKCAHELRSHGYSCLVVDHFHSFTYNEIVKLLNQCVGKQTTMIGFSTSFFQDVSQVPSDGHIKYNDLNVSISFCPQGVEFEAQLIRQLKQLSPNCKIVIGGAKTQQQLNNKNIDFAVIGHAEISIVDLMNHLRHKKDLPNAQKNIWGITIVNDAESKKYNFARGHMVWQPSDILNAQVLPLESARGCIFNCRFCGYPMRGKKNLDYVRNADSIYQELYENYHQYGIKTYSLMDDTFNDNDEKLDLILSAVKRLDFQPIFWSYARLDLLSIKEERLPKMFDIGVRAMFLGIETLNDRTGRIVGKGHSRAEQIKTINQIRKQYNDQVMLHGSFIIGLPEESKNDIHHTFDALMDETIGLHSFRFQPLRIARNRTVWPSDFDLNYEKYGYVDQTPDLPLELDWKNDLMDRDWAIHTAQEFHQIASRSQRYRLPNQTLWCLLNYGYEFDQLAKTPNTNIDWHQVTQRKKQYINDYKTQLFDLILK